MSDSVEASAEVSHSEGSVKLNERPEPVVEEAVEAAGDNSTKSDSPNVEPPPQVVVVDAVSEAEKIADDNQIVSEAVEKPENSKEETAVESQDNKDESDSTKEVPEAPKENNTEITLPDSTTLSAAGSDTRAAPPVKERLIEDGGMDFKSARKMMEKKKGAIGASTDSISVSMTSNRVPPIKIPDSGSNSSAEALTAPAIKEPTSIKDAKLQRKRAIPVKFQVHSRILDRGSLKSTQPKLITAFLKHQPVSHYHAHEQ